jgi:hypothetical protein
MYEVLRAVVAQWSMVYIVVDALDETPEDNRLTLLDYLTNLGPTVFLMLTSRHDVSLPKINAVILDISSPERDIESYVRAQIIQSTHLTSVLDGTLNLQEEIIANIVRNADGM